MKDFRTHVERKKLNFSHKALAVTPRLLKLVRTKLSTERLSRAGVGRLLHVCTTAVHISSLINVAYSVAGEGGEGYYCKGVANEPPLEPSNALFTAQVRLIMTSAQQWQTVSHSRISSLQISGDF